MGGGRGERGGWGVGGGGERSSRGAKGMRRLVGVGVGWGAVLWESSQSVFRTAIGRVTDNAKQTNS